MKLKITCNALFVYSALCLISTTITVITTRCTTKIVHIIWTTISHFDVCWHLTAVWSPVETSLPANLTVCYCGVSTLHPSGSICATSVFRWTWSWHSCAGGPLKTKPTRYDSTVTITGASRVRNLSGITIKASVILTLRYRKNKIKIIIIRINLTRKLFNILIFLVV